MTNFNASEFPMLPQQQSNNNRATGPAVFASGAGKEVIVVKKFELFADEYRSKIENSIAKQTIQSAMSKIAYETSTNIEFSISQNQYLTFIVTGTEAKAEKACTKIHENFYTMPSKVITIKKRYHRMIVGFKGLKIQEIENLSGAKIRIPQLKDVSESIVICGPKASIERAENEINQIVFNIENQTKETIAIAKKYHVFVRGAENRVLNEISEKTMVRISMPDATTESEQILLSGFKANVLEAKTELLKIVESLQTDFTSVLIEIPKEQHRFIIDQGFMNKILLEFNVSLEVPAPGSDSINVRLTGPISSVCNSLKFVYEYAVSMKFVTIPMDNCFHNYLIGKKGSNLQQFKLKYPKSTIRCLKLENRIELEGPIDEIDPFHLEITELVDSVKCNEIKIEDQFIGLVIGQNGKNLNKLVDEHNVYVDRIFLDESERETDGCKNILRIVGLEKNVCKAFDYLTALIEKLRDETTKSLTVASKYLGNLIGKKGANIRKLREDFETVTIRIVDDETENQSTFRIRGPSADVEQVYNQLSNEVNELVAESFSHSIAIDDHIFKYFYNNDLLKMRKLQTEYDVHLDYRGDKQVLLVRGKEENVLRVEKCITKILGDWVDKIIKCELQVPKELEVLVDFMSQDFFSSLFKKNSNVLVNVHERKLQLIGLKDQIQNVREIFENSTIYCRKIQLETPQQKMILSRILRDITDRHNTMSTIVIVSKEPLEVYTLIMGNEKSTKDSADLFEQFTQNIQELSESSINISNEQFVYFTANRKQLINRLVEESNFNVSINFVKNRLFVSGQKANVDVTIAKINEQIGEFNSFVEKECEIDQKFHKYIIGSRGANLKAICEQYNVSIKMPEKYDEDGENTNGSLVRVRGLDENCSRAIDAMKAQLPITANISIASELHHLIVGPRGENIRNLRQKFNVHIDVPHGMKQSNEIKITGLKNDVENATNALKDLTNEIEVEIDPKWYPRIIGRKGLTIKKLRAEHNVRIVFGNDTNADSRLVRISGPIEGCEAAKADILQLIEDDY